MKITGVCSLNNDGSQSQPLDTNPASFITFDGDDDSPESGVVVLDSVESESSKAGAKSGDENIGDSPESPEAEELDIEDSPESPDAEKLNIGDSPESLEAKEVIIGVGDSPESPDPETFNGDPESPDPDAYLQGTPKLFDDDTSLDVQMIVDDDDIEYTTVMENSDGDGDTQPDGTATSHESPESPSDNVPDTTADSSSENTSALKARVEDGEHGENVDFAFSLDTRGDGNNQPLPEENETDAEDVEISAVGYFSGVPCSSSSSRASVSTPLPIILKTETSSQKSNNENKSGKSPQNEEQHEKQTAPMDVEQIPVYTVEDGVVFKDSVEIIDLEEGKRTTTSSPPPVQISRPNPKQSCFNCLGDHNVQMCQKEKNYALINKRRQEFRSKGPGAGSQNHAPGRYHEKKTLEEMYSHFKPGVISYELRKALGLWGPELPNHIYNMRLHGYPPGWLRNAVEPPSGLKFYGSDIVRKTSPELTTGTLKIEKLVDYPGFTSPSPPEARDEGKRFGYPYSSSHSLENLVRKWNEEQKNKASPKIPEETRSWTQRERDPSPVRAPQCNRESSASNSVPEAQPQPGFKWYEGVFNAPPVNHFRPPAPMSDVAFIENLYQQQLRQKSRNPFRIRSQPQSQRQATNYQMTQELELREEENQKALKLQKRYDTGTTTANHKGQSSRSRSPSLLEHSGLHQSMAVVGTSDKASVSSAGDDDEVMIVEQNQTKRSEEVVLESDSEDDEVEKARAKKKPRMTETIEIEDEDGDEDGGELSDAGSNSNWKRPRTQCPPAPIIRDLDKEKSPQKNKKRDEKAETTTAQKSSSNSKREDGEVSTSCAELEQHGSSPGNKPDTADCDGSTTSKEDDLEVVDTPQSRQSSSGVVTVDEMKVIATQSGAFGKTKNVCKLEMCNDSESTCDDRTPLVGSPPKKCSSNTKTQIGSPGKNARDIKMDKSVERTNALDIRSPHKASKLYAIEKPSADESSEKLMKVLERELVHDKDKSPVFIGLPPMENFSRGMPELPLMEEAVEFKGHLNRVLGVIRRNKGDGSLPGPPGVDSDDDIEVIN